MEVPLLTVAREADVLAIVAGMDRSEMIRAATEAEELFGIDECERWAEMLRQRKGGARCSSI